MKIIVAGPGCTKCNLSFKLVTQVLEDMNSDFEVEKVIDIMKLLQLGVRSTPSILIDSKIVISGRIPTYNEIVDIVKTESK
jgi:small redox-active disulfide protein 2